MAGGSVRDDLAAAGQELLAKAQTLADTLSDVGELAGAAADDIKARLATLATDIDTLVADVRGDDDDDGGDDDAEPEAEAAGTPV